MKRTGLLIICVGIAFSLLLGTAIAKETVVVYTSLETEETVDYLELAKKELEEGDVPFSEEAFLVSVEKNDADTVRLFLKAGMAPDVQDAQGNTALISDFTWECRCHRNTAQSRGQCRSVKWGRKQRPDPRPSKGR